MANWEATTQASSFDAQAAARTAMDSRNSTRSSSNASGGYNPGGLFGWGKSEFSIVGIDANRVPEMREQIRSSVQAIQNHLDGIESQTNSSNAFRSEEIKAAVEKYVDAVKEYSKALISDLLAFSDKLQEVREAWEQSTQNFAADSVNSSVTGMSDSTTYYTETK